MSLTPAPENYTDAAASPPAIETPNTNGDTMIHVISVQSTALEALPHSPTPAAAVPPDSQQAAPTNAVPLSAAERAHRRHERHKRNLVHCWCCRIHQRTLTIAVLLAFGVAVIIALLTAPQYIGQAMDFFQSLDPDNPATAVSCFFLLWLTCIPVVPGYGYACS